MKTPEQLMDWALKLARNADRAQVTIAVANALAQIQRETAEECAGAYVRAGKVSDNPCLHRRALLAIVQANYEDPRVGWGWAKQFAYSYLDPKIECGIDPCERCGKPRGSAGECCGCGEPR